MKKAIGNNPHGVVVTAAGKRYELSELGHGRDYELQYRGAGGWSLWHGEEIVAGRYDDGGLRIEINGHVIYDNTRPTKEDSGNVDSRFEIIEKVEYPRGHIIKDKNTGILYLRTFSGPHGMSMCRLWEK